MTACKGNELPTASVQPKRKVYMMLNNLPLYKKSNK